MRITRDIYQVGGDGLTTDQDAAVYLIHGLGHAVLIDAGTGFELEKLLENIRGTGVSEKSIDRLLLTHCHFDHSGGAKALRDSTGCRVVAHEIDAPFIENGNDEVSAATWYDAKMTPCPVDVKITGNSRVLPMGGGAVISALHLPGHTPGSVVYFMESDNQKVLFGQDVHGPLHPSFHSNRSDYQKSLKRMIDLKADILCEGHYGVLRGKSSVEQFIRSFLDT